MQYAFNQGCKRLQHLLMQYSFCRVKYVLHAISIVYFILILCLIIQQQIPLFLIITTCNISVGIIDRVQINIINKKHNLFIFFLFDFLYIFLLKNYNIIINHMQN